MSRIHLIFLFVFVGHFIVKAQNNNLNDYKGCKENSEIQMFYEKYNLWISSTNKDIPLDEEAMINNFIVFSQDGLIMKDLEIHSVESCKIEILKNIPNSDIQDDNYWIYVSIESNLNKFNLSEILAFLSVKKIDFYFESEDKLLLKF